MSVVFTFNGGNLQGREIVVFESLLREDFEIATHADINDGKQTVKFINPLIPSDKSNTYLSKKLPSSSTSVISSDSSLPQTGSSKSGYLTIIGLVLADIRFCYLLS